MSTVIPNRLNDVIQSLGAQMIQLMMENKRFTLEERRLSQADKQIELDRQNSALQRLVTVSPFLPHGKTLAEMPEIHDTIREAFPGFDPADPANMGGIVFNPETVEHVLQPMVIASLQAMPDEQKQSWTTRALNRIGLGTPASAAELLQGESQAQTYLDAMHDLRQDPKALEGIFRRSVGLEVPTRVMYNGTEIKFDTATAASITAQLWQHRDSMNLQWTALNRPQQLDLAGELIGQMQKNNITLGRAAATSIIAAYDQREQLRRSNRLTEQNDPVKALYNSSVPEVRTSIQAFESAVSFGDQAYRQWLSTTPEGLQTIRFMDLGNALHQGGIPQENIPRLLDSITHSAAIGQSSGLPVYTAPGYFGGNALEFRPSGPAPTTTPGGTQLSGEQLRGQMESDAAALARGTMTLQQINSRYTNPAQRNAVVMKSRILRQATGRSGRQ